MTESDHDLVMGLFKLTGSVGTNSSTRARDYRKVDLEMYKLELLGMKWTKVYESKDPSVVAAVIIELMINVLDRMTK